MPITSGINANIFRAVSGNLFSTAANWSRGVVPTGSDVAMIGDNCVIDISRTIGTLVVSPGFTASINTGLTLNISQSINVLGHLSCSGNPTIISLASKNNINSFSPGSSTFIYNGAADQNVPGINYYNLNIASSDSKSISGGINIGLGGLKTLTGNVLVLGNFNVGTNGGISGVGTGSPKFELKNYTLIVSGSTTLQGCLFSANNYGNIIFIGDYDASSPTGHTIDLLGNPNIEFRGTTVYLRSPGSIPGYYGQGTILLSTNNKTLTVISETLTNTIIISGSINVTLTNTLNLSNTINGASTSDRLTNTGTINFISSNALLNSMVTGSFNTTSSNNTIGIGGNYSATIPARFNAFRDLAISGTGIKTLGTSSYISGALTLNDPGVLELSSYNLIVSGTTNISSTNGLTKSSPGNITFIGRPTINNPYTINLSGNPNVECRNGILNQSNPTSNLGTGSWTFTTNNQDLTWGGSGNSSEFYNVIVSGSITVNAKSNYVAIRNSLNGTEAGSTFVNSGSLYLFFGSTPMSIGSLIIPTGSSNLIGYFVSGAFTIPRTAYYSLAVGGGGQKTLSGNTTIYGDLTIAAGLTSSLECLGYNLIVSGTTTVAGDGAYINIPSLNISGSGNIVFRGLFNVANPGNISFPGNPNIELQGGIQFQSNNNPNVGTGSWTFTTNNQNLIFAGSGPTYNIYNMIVSGAITLTYTGDTIRNINSLNGTNPNSKLLMAANSTFYYYGSSAPMSTGILDVTSSLGTTFVYASGSQNIKGGIYRNLTMNYGTKTLQGNVSVLGTLNTGSGATLATVNLNGFTLTNP
jgi:hypothetical protein